MNEYNLTRTIQTWSIGVVVFLAVGAGLCFRGFSGETVSEAIKDLGIALMPIFSAFIAAHLVTRHIRPEERYQLEGEKALRKVGLENSDILAGPKYNRENYGQEKPTHAGRYLFVQKERKGQKVQLVPLNPLKEGVLEFRVYKTTQSLLGIEKELSEIKEELERNVLKVLEEGKYHQAFEIIEHEQENICLAIDFDERQLGFRKFHKAILECTQAAVKVLRSLSK